MEDQLCRQGRSTRKLQLWGIDSTRGRRTVGVPKFLLLPGGERRDEGEGDVINAFVKESPISHRLIAEEIKMETGATPVLRGYRKQL